MSHYRRARAAGGTYFFTVALADRHSSLLIDEISRLRRAWEKVAQAHSFTTVAVCILTDHLHAIWTLPADDIDFSLRWRLIKFHFSRSLDASFLRSDSKQRHREKGLWQRRFWEHQIRDDADLQRHVDYVHFNPVKHGLVTRVGDWPYSSFPRWVADGRLPEDWAGNSKHEGGFGE